MAGRVIFPKANKSSPRDLIMGHVMFIFLGGGVLSLSLSSSTLCLVRRLGISNIYTRVKCASEHKLEYQVGRAL